MIELRIRIDKEDIMHDKGRGPIGVFQEATQATAWGSKETDTGQRPEILKSWRALC